MPVAYLKTVKKFKQMKTNYFTSLLFIVSFLLLVQNPAIAKEKILNGYQKKIAGADSRSQSPVPFANECLIVRATDGTSSMEWETAPAPETIEGDFVTYAWLAGVGSSPGAARFDLAVNGDPVFSFWTNGQGVWKEQTTDGATLSFSQDLVGRYGNHFGFMYLRLPKKMVDPGKPLRIKVTGGEFHKDSWYMTFKYPLENAMEFNTYPALMRQGDPGRQLGIAKVFYVGESSTAKFFIDGEFLKELPLKFGYNHLRLELPGVQKEKTIPWKLDAGDFSQSGEMVMQPVRHWQVNFVQHTHTDIGYTRSQTEILGEHLRFIDYALDYCDLTDDYPDDSKFRWTCEAMWPVNEYLRSRPAEQVERLRKRVAEGRIEIAGMYFNFDELPDEQILAASLQPLKNIREAGLEVKTAMQNDVNGIGWCLNDYYSDLGVDYLNMGTHGHKALISFEKPTLFWWESPSGNKMLTYRAEHYMTGNFFDIHKKDFEAFEEKLLSYLIGLGKKGYEYELTSIQHSGYFTDNSPPSTRASDMIRKWNEKYSWPKLKTATATEFFETMERKHGDEFRTIRGAWPDWWTDGFGASAREVETTRRAQTDLLANMAGLTMAKILGSEMPGKIDDRIYWANNALLFYTEHTVGYHGSVSQPFHKYSMEQRALKESYAWEAGRRAKMIGEEVLGLLQSHVEREAEPAIVVFNTLNFERSGLVKVYMDHQLVPPDREFRIVDRQGNAVPAQAVETHSDGAYWALWVDHVPPFGYKKMVIKVGEQLKQGPKNLEKVTELQNQWYKLEIDQERGAITSLFDKEINRELVDPNAGWKLGEFIYETLGNRHQLNQFRLEDYQREPLDEVWFERYEEGDIWNTAYFKGNTRAAIRDGSYEFEIRLFNTAKRIDLSYSILKKSVTDPEGIYIAFPFVMDDGVLAFDVQGGEVRAGMDQIPGSSNDWNVVQNYARLKNGEAQILLSSQEIPFMQFGGINTGRFEYGALPESTHIYGWPMNNYWTTNFNAEQRGGIDWVYTISSAENPSPTLATQFGWNNRVPFLARVLSGGGPGDDSWEASIISGWPENVILVSSRPAREGNAFLLHVRETAGRPADLESLKLMDHPSVTIREVNVLGEPVNPGSSRLKPLEAKFFRVSW